MGVPARVTLVTLGVRDLGRSVAFYEEVGWSRSSASTDEVAFFHTAGCVLALFGWDDLAADAHVSPSGEGFRGVTVAINCASRNEVDAAVAAWVAAGGDVVKAPEEVFWGGYSGYVADPDGHLIELAHNPFFPLRDDGTVDLPA